MIDYETLIAASVREMRQMKEQHQTIRLDLDPEIAMMLIGALQLVCRHPGFQKTKSYPTIQELISEISSYFQPYPALRDLIRLGELPEHDQ